VTQTTKEKTQEIADFEMPPLEPTMFWRAWRAVFRAIATLALDLKVYESHHLPETGGVLIAPNHQSFLDPVLVAVKLRRAVAFMAKSGLFKPWGFRWIIRQLHAFPVRQGKGDVAAMKQSIAVLQAGRALVVFPEGGRTPDGKIQPLAAGAGLLIKRAKVPVVPVAIDGAFKAWPIHRLLPRAGKVRVLYGAPMILHEMDGRAAIEALEAELRRLHARLLEMP
jgi:1-acyl-sn-glycerol-3-phosphate acyltransferase